MAAPTKPVERLRKDYAPTPYLIPSVYLDFDLHEASSVVKSKLRLVPNHSVSSPQSLFLNGHKDVVLESIQVNGKDLAPEKYELSEEGLTLHADAIPSGELDLEITTRIKPQDNTSLEGVFKSGGMFCSQCEAEGFRHITYFLDRPDIMAKYTTRVAADKASYPVLLSNGNLIEQGDLPDGRHFAVWEDPFAKPCYLFALVAGNLLVKEDSFRTASGRDVALRIFVDAHNIGKVDFAMQSLKHAMKWDEEAFGLEYDLDLFNIVAVDDFNMGAMENKSLNLFNSRLVLATPDTATDADFGRIEGVVGHEYFHNWTGNRVTCRDWFQLTLKEGLTVYRDQEFSADMNSRGVQRIADAVRLRAAQFAEDAGPQAHPIRPEAVIKMDNFYTMTVYEKGAEVVRVYEALLGKSGFRAGMDLYFKRHDGHAVTCDDFRAAMADANGVALPDGGAMEAWYSQAGTPRLRVALVHDAGTQTLTLTASQTTPPSRGQPDKRPVLIPIRVALLGPDGVALPLRLRGTNSGADDTAVAASFVNGKSSSSSPASPPATEVVLALDTDQQEWVFEDVAERPVTSVLRGFSAPVVLEVEGRDREDLLFLLAHDDDPFNRWEAGQTLARQALISAYQACRDAPDVDAADATREAVRAAIDGAHVDAIRSLLADADADRAFLACALALPEASELQRELQGVDPVRLHAVREAAARHLATLLRPELQAALAACDDAPGVAYAFNAAAAGRRALKNAALGYLSRLGDADVTADAERRFTSATNMTDEMAALAALDRAGGEVRSKALQAFYQKWEHEPLVLLKWLTIQAASNLPGNTDAVRSLLEHGAVKLSNPNTCYSLFLGYARSPVNFHAADGSGYGFMADAVLRVDSINPQVASRMVAAFNDWRDYDQTRGEAMVAALRRIASAPGISPNVYELVSKAMPGDAE